MAIKRDQLLDALDALRESIKHEIYESTGKDVFICSDETLKEIAIKKPLKTSDFLAISGINKTFMDQYAYRFLQVIMHESQKHIDEVGVSKHAYKILDHYKDRLTNISKRNTNLYMGKISKKKTFDLNRIDMASKLFNFLTNKRVSKMTLNDKDQVLLNDEIDDLTQLYRHINQVNRETGSYDLYIAYPFVELSKPKDHLMIKAPLLFFPVKLMRTKKVFVIKKDKDKDIQYNRDLLLALSKMEKSAIESKTSYTDDFDLKHINEVVIPFYESHGLVIKDKIKQLTIEPFSNELKKDFLKRIKNKINLRHFMTLGTYQLYASMIQKDINQILASNKYNKLLEGLIDEKGLYADDQRVFSIDHLKIKESNISYISDLNFSQEKVIDLLNQEEKLVIWGPPGTGKSQTITNLIASSILNHQKVLVISEKKVALDVIYSRLKDASKYAMFIDDAQNKQVFYDQLKSFIDPMPPTRTMNNDVFDIEEQIHALIETFDASLKSMYLEEIQGRKAYTLYHRYVVDKDIKEDLLPLHVHKMFTQYFKHIDFDRLEDIEKTFKQKKHLDEYLLYHQMLRRYPLLSKIESKLTRSQKLIYKDFSKDFESFKYDLKHTWFFKRRKLKQSFANTHINNLSFLSHKNRFIKKYFKRLFKDEKLHTYYLTHLNDLNRIRTKYEQLDTYHLTFLDMLCDAPLLQEIEDVSHLRTYLFDAFYTGYLESFYAKRQSYLYILEKHEEKFNQLNQLISAKKQVNTESFNMFLYQEALGFSNTKRIMDIKRVIDGQNRMSIKSFIDVFQLELFHHVRIWMMTPEVVSTIMPLIYGMFDIVIFDEASQMYVEKGIPAIYRAKKVVIAGDTKQLRPSSLGIGKITENNDDDGEVLQDISKDAKSLLDLARYRYQETVLNYHYRSIYEELIAFSNHAFYDGKLIVSPNQHHMEKPPIEYVYVKNGVFEHRRNVEEAKKVISLLKHIFKTRKNNETIGVITFSATQRDLIENLVDEALFKSGKYQKMFEKELFRTEDKEDKSLFIKNIENVQGDERDIIIFSMGYAKDANGIVKRNFGWLNNEGGQNRLNVAISRAKQKIYFVSSLYPEELKVDDLSSVGPKLLKDYMRYCYFISKGQQDDARKLLLSLSNQQDTLNISARHQMTEDIKKRLERNHYEVIKNVGIGGYTLDLAIYDRDRQSYILGIICDLSDDMHVDARKELLHLDKYLKARHWHIYRVFSSNWYKNPNQELRHMRAKIKEINHE